VTEPGTAQVGCAPSGHTPSGRLAELCEAFFDLEEELGLFARRIDGCPFWDHVRVRVHDHILRELGLVAEKHQEPDHRMRALLRAAPRVAAGLVTHDPFLARPADWVFLGHPRRVRGRDGYYWDPYVDPYARHLAPHSLVLERPFHNRHWTPARSPRIAHLDAVALVAALRKPFVGDPVDRRAAAELDSIGEAIADSFGVDVPVTGWVRRRLVWRRAQLPVFRALLRKLRPKVLFVVVGYGNEIPIEAARHLGIPCVELQHGLISPFHAGYTFPRASSRKSTFPDWVFTFGQFWDGAARWPIHPSRVVPIGNAWLEERRAELAPREAADGPVVFLSQRTVGARLARLAAELVRLEPSREVVFKLHPGEVGDWRKVYPDLGASGVRAVEPGADLYGLLARASMAVGVYSTALFEALALGTPAAVAELPGIEHAERLLEGGSGLAVRAVRSAAELANWIDEAERGRGNGADVLFRPHALENFDRALAAVVSSRC
jgi:hypothetical protein